MRLGCRIDFPELHRIDPEGRKYNNRGSFHQVAKVLGIAIFTFPDDDAVHFIFETAVLETAVWTT